ncbi:hypothetical protein LINPERHAP2_LOCUS19819 [Linum perenne]
MEVSMVSMGKAAQVMKQTVGILRRDKASLGAQGWKKSEMSKSGENSVRMSENWEVDVSIACKRVGMRCLGRPLVVWE